MVKLSSASDERWRIEELTRVLQELYPVPSDLRGFLLRFHAGGKQLCQCIAWNGSANAVYLEVAEQLQAHGLTNGQFLAALRRDRPHQTQLLRSLEEVWGEAPTPHWEATARNAEQLLDHAEKRRKRLQEAGQSTTHLTQEILTLKRTLRRGPQVQPGDMFANGRYLVLEKVGHGGFGTVWKARDHARDIDVAVKVLHSNLAQEPMHRARFLRGARVMAALQHPDVIRVEEPPQLEDGFYHFVMALAAGTLQDAILQGSPLACSIPALMIRLGRMLVTAHEHGYIHRDIKPTNILIMPDGEPKLSDFDLVAGADTTGGTRTAALGTFLYAAPEQLESPKHADARVDVYGLAMTMIFALHGRSLPITIFRDAPGFVRQYIQDAPLAEVLARAVAWEREDRFPTMAEFCDALERPHLAATTRLHKAGISAAPSKEPLLSSVQSALSAFFKTGAKGTPITDTIPTSDGEIPFAKLVGNWRADETNSLYCVRALYRQLWWPYSYAGASSLTAEFHGFRATADGFVCQFQWFRKRGQHLPPPAGYVYLSLRDHNTLEGGWWYEHNVIPEVLKDYSQLHIAMPHMHRLLLRRVPSYDPPWLAQYFSAKLDNLAHNATVGRATTRSSQGKRAANHKASLGRVLWVDDNPSNNEEERAWLRMLGITVDNVVSTTEAQALLAKKRYDLIITDLVRDRSSDSSPEAGLELLTLSEVVASPAPLIIYTSEQHQARFPYLLQRGAYGATANPFELRQLVRSALDIRAS